jgi:hypothetical protein
MRALLKNRGLMEQATLASSQAASPTSAPTSAPTVLGKAAASDQAPAPSAAMSDSNMVLDTDLDYEAESEYDSDKSVTLGLDSQLTQHTELFDISQGEDADDVEGVTVPFYEMSLYLSVRHGEFRLACEQTNISRFFDKDDDLSITMPVQTRARRVKYTIPKKPPKSKTKGTGVVATTTRKPGYMTDRLMDLIQNAVMVSRG